jgi:hypothetical protein
MSKTVPCVNCGQPRQMPAFPGDGTYDTHVCPAPIFCRTCELPVYPQFLPACNWLDCSAASRGFR